MCPMCVTSAVVIGLGSASGAGVLGVIALRLRKLRRTRQRAAVRSSAGGGDLT